MGTFWTVFIICVCAFILFSCLRACCCPRGQPILRRTVITRVQPQFVVVGSNVPEGQLNSTVYPHYGQPNQMSYEPNVTVWTTATPVVSAQPGQYQQQQPELIPVHGPYQQQQDLPPAYSSLKFPN